MGSKYTTPKPSVTVVCTCRRDLRLMFCSPRPYRASELYPNFFASSLMTTLLIYVKKHENFTRTRTHLAKNARSRTFFRTVSLPVSAPYLRSSKEKIDIVPEVHPTSCKKFRVLAFHTRTQKNKI